jgi:hypothetical protein
MRFHSKSLQLIFKRIGPLAFVLVPGGWSAQSVSAPHRDETTAVALLKRAGASIVELNNEQDGHGLAIDFNRKISNNDLKPVTGLERLIGIRILGGGITEDGLRYIDQVPNLRLLVIKSEAVTDKGLESIGKLKSLIKLDFMKANISGKGLAHLSGLTNLKRLYLYSTKVRDDDLAPLEKMSSLKLIDLPSTVTDAGVARLKRALPGAEISRMR